MAQNLGNFEVGVNITAQEALNKLNELYARVKKLQDILANPPKNSTQANINSWTKDLENAQARIESLNNALDKTENQTYNTFRAVGQADRITREFASGGLTQGLNGLTMFGNSLVRLSVQEGGFKNALSGLASAFTGPAGIVLLVSAAVGVFEQLQKKLNESKSALDELAKSIKELNGQLSTIGGASQAKLETARMFGNIVGDTSKPIDQRKSALIQLKGIYSENVALQKLEINSNKDYINSLINQAAAQENLASRQKNTQSQLEAYYKTEKELQSKRRTDLAAITGPVAERVGGPMSTIYRDVSVAEQQNRINVAYSKALEQARQTSNYYNLIKENAQQVNSLSGFAQPEKTGRTSVINEREEEAKRLRLQLFYLNQEMQKFKDLSKAGTLAPIQSIESLQDKADKSKKEESAFWKNPLSQISESTQDSLTKYIQKKKEQFDIQEKLDEQTKKELKAQEDAAKRAAETLSGQLTNAFKGMVDSIASGKDALESLGDAFKKLAEDIMFAIIKQEIYNALTSGMGDKTPAQTNVTGGGFDLGTIGKMIANFAPLFLADGGVVDRPTLSVIGEGSQKEAVMPLSKLQGMMHSSFNAGAMNGGASSGGSFVLRGQDLLVAINRTQKSSALKGQSINLI